MKYVSGKEEDFRWKQSHQHQLEDQHEHQYQHQDHYQHDHQHQHQDQHEHQDHYQDHHQDQDQHEHQIQLTDMTKLSLPVDVSTLTHRSTICRDTHSLK